MSLQTASPDLSAGAPEDWRCGDRAHISRGHPLVIAGRQPQDGALRPERESRDIPEGVDLPEGVLTETQQGQRDRIAPRDVELTDRSEGGNLLSIRRQVEEASVVVGTRGEFEEQREIAEDDAAMLVRCSRSATSRLPPNTRCLQPWSDTTPVLLKSLLPPVLFQLPPHVTGHNPSTLDGVA
jgi:hypothetical protein